MNVLLGYFLFLFISNSEYIGTSYWHKAPCAMQMGKLASFFRVRERVKNVT